MSKYGDGEKKEKYRSKDRMYVGITVAYVCRRKRWRMEESDGEKEKRTRRERGGGERARKESSSLFFPFLSTFSFPFLFPFLCCLVFNRVVVFNVDLHEAGLVEKGIGKGGGIGEPLGPILRGAMVFLS